MFHSLELDPIQNQGVIKKKVKMGHWVGPAIFVFLVLQPRVRVLERLQTEAGKDILAS